MRPLCFVNSLKNVLPLPILCLNSKQMKVFESSIDVLLDLKAAIQELPQKEYSQSIDFMFNASVGQHCRHIVEFFQCLQAQCITGKICYDLRQRNLQIEQSQNYAIDAIEQVIEWLSTAPDDKKLYLMVNHELEDEGAQTSVQSSLIRELVFNIEHAIHHMAIIKIGLKLTLPSLELPEHFGVAPSTIRHNQTRQITA